MTSGDGTPLRPIVFKVSRRCNTASRQGRRMSRIVATAA